MNESKPARIEINVLSDLPLRIIPCSSESDGRANIIVPREREREREREIPGGLRIAPTINNLSDSAHLLSLLDSRTSSGRVDDTIPQTRSIERHRVVGTAGC